MNLKADSLKFDDRQRRMVASSNVQLIYQGVTVNTSRLIVDVDKNIAWGTRNVTIVRDGQSIYAKGFSYSLNTKAIDLDEVRLVSKPDDLATGNLFLKAKRISDQADVKLGYEGTLTTCDQDPPHYFVTAESFEYYPDDKIIGKNVFVYAPISMIPFGTWLPYYSYEIGKRNLIFLIPLVGRNDKEGWFVRSTWDYYYGKNQSGQIYIDWFEKLGIGLGAKPSYSLSDRLTGSIYYYFVNERQGPHDFAIKLENSYKLSDTAKLDIFYYDVDKYTLSLDTRQTQIDKGFSYSNVDIGTKQQLDVKKQQNFSGDSTLVSIAYTDDFDSTRVWDARFQETKNRFAIQRSLVVAENHALPSAFTLKNNWQYTSQRLSTDYNDDELLNTHTVLSHDLYDLGTASLTFDKYFDPDGNRFIENGYINQVERVPEISVAWKPTSLGPFSYSLNTSAARIRERRSGFTNGDVRDYSGTRFKIENKLSNTFSGLPLSSGVTLETNYTQFLYNDTKDKLYTLKQQVRVNNDFVPGLGLSGTYSYGLSEGNSPFISLPDEPIQSGVGDNSFPTYALNNQVTLTVLNYLFDRSKFYLKNTSGWDFQGKKPQNLNSELSISPSSNFLMNIKTTYLFPQNRFEPNTRFDPLVSTLQYRPDPLSFIMLSHTYDLNIWQTKQFSSDFGFVLGGEPNYRWELTSRFIYDADGGSIQMDAINAIKREHCRSLTFSWHRTLHEFRFMYTITAFPNDSIGYSSDDIESFKLQGVLNDTATDRF